MRRRVVPAKVFLSYSTKDKFYVGVLKDEIEKYGVQCFLAHEDILVSSEWRTKILQELYVTDLYVPVLTKHFRRSKWTDQEAGIALARDVDIFPLWISVKPYGFLEAYQATKRKLETIKDACPEIIRCLCNKPDTSTKLIDGFIDMFIKSDCFITANEHSERLFDLTGFSKAQVNRLISGALENDQIHKANVASRSLIRFVRMHGSKMSGPLQERFAKVIGRI